MGTQINQGSLSIGHRSQQSGPPFTANAARNGVSVATSDGAIVLGQDNGDPANPALVTNARQIPIDVTGTLFITDINGLLYGIIDVANGTVALGVEIGFTEPVAIRMNAQGAFPQVAIHAGGVNGEIRLEAGRILWSGGGPPRTATSSVLVFNTVNENIQAIVGASGNFTTTDGKTVTVLDGVITSIV